MRSSMPSPSWSQMYGPAHAAPRTPSRAAAQHATATSPRARAKRRPFGGRMVMASVSPQGLEAGLSGSHNKNGRNGLVRCIRASLEELPGVLGGAKCALEGALRLRQRLDAELAPEQATQALGLHHGRAPVAGLHEALDDGDARRLAELVEVRRAPERREGALGLARPFEQPAELDPGRLG